MGLAKYRKFTGSGMAVLEFFRVTGPLLVQIYHLYRYGGFATRGCMRRPHRYSWKGVRAHRLPDLIVLCDSTGILRPKRNPGDQFAVTITLLQTNLLSDQIAT
jgi:hypothetical protein